MSERERTGAGADSDAAHDREQREALEVAQSRLAALRLDAQVTSSPGHAEALAAQAEALAMAKDAAAEVAAALAAREETTRALELSVATASSNLATHRAQAKPGALAFLAAVSAVVGYCWLLGWLITDGSAWHRLLEVVSVGAGFALGFVWKRYLTQRPAVREPVTRE